MGLEEGRGGGKGNEGKGEMQEEVQVGNGSTMDIPLQCTMFFPDKIFIRETNAEKTVLNMKTFVQEWTEYDVRDKYPSDFDSVPKNIVFSVVHRAGTWSSTILPAHKNHIQSREETFIDVSPIFIVCRVFL